MGRRCTSVSRSIVDREGEANEVNRRACNSHGSRPCRPPIHGASRRRAKRTDRSRRNRHAYRRNFQDSPTLHRHSLQPWPVLPINSLLGVRVVIHGIANCLNRRDRRRTRCYQYCVRRPIVVNRYTPRWGQASENQRNPKAYHLRPDPDGEFFVFRVYFRRGLRTGVGAGETRVYFLHGGSCVFMA